MTPARIEARRKEAPLTKRLLAVLAAAGLTTTGWGYSYNGLTYSSNVVYGQWTSAYSAAKAEAKAHNVPMVVVWANPGCGYCQNFESSVGGSSTVQSWAQKRGYVFVFALGTSTSSSLGMTAGDVTAAQTFARGGSLTKYPFVGIWWPKGADGKEVKAHFSGRSGIMAVKSGSLAQQFMDSVDHYVGAYAGAGVKTVTARFDANGGSKLSFSSAVVMTGRAVGTLPTVTRSGYKFDGWHTEKTGGVMISSSTVISGDTTFYAHWLKAVKISAAVSPTGSGSVSGAGNFLEGETANLKATPKSGYVLSAWKDEKGNVLVRTPVYSCLAGSADAKYTAVFIRKKDDFVDLACTPEAEYVTREAIMPLAVDIESGSAATVKATSLPSGLVFRENAISGIPSKSGLFTAKLSATTAGGAKGELTLGFVIRMANERIVRVSCAAESGTVKGSGVYADGKKATVRATAKSGWAFAGWTEDGVLVSRNASYAMKVDGRDRTLVANFVRKVDDYASMRLELDGREQFADSLSTNILQCGVATNLTVVATADSGATVAVSSLPTGLKLNKTLIDKETKTWAYVVSGVPTSAKTFVSKIKVSTNGGNAIAYRVAFVCRELPAWAVGSFGGFAAAEGAGFGSASLTVSAKGKTSGKFSLFGTNWTYSAASYTSFAAAKDEREMTFAMTGVAKRSKQTRPLSLVVSWGAHGCSYALLKSGEAVAELRRNVWKDGSAIPSPKLAKTSLAALGYEKLSLSVSAAGKATFAGKLPDGHSASSSATAFVDDGLAVFAPLVIPYSKTYPGFADVIRFKEVK